MGPLVRRATFRYQPLDFFSWPNVAGATVKAAEKEEAKKFVQ
jgi:hypothetical protein